MSKSIWGMLFGSFLLHLFVNLLIACLVVQLISDSADEKVFMFIATVAFLYIAPMMFGLKNAFINIGFSYLRRAKVREEFFIALKQAEMPTASDYPYFDADEYLAQVIKDEALEPKPRMKAVEILSALTTLRQNSYVQAIFMNMALDGAVRDLFARSD